MLKQAVAYIWLPGVNILYTLHDRRDERHFVSLNHMHD
jgi:hypothetical protein